jgi:hypothetical protein
MHGGQEAGRVAEEEDQKIKSVQFHYLKSSAFRVVHADGVFGGVSPGGFIFMSLFSERPPIPDTTTHEVKDGRIGDELTEERISRNGIVRELEVGVVLDLRTAAALHDWLAQKIELLTEAQKKSKQEEKESVKTPERRK